MQHGHIRPCIPVSAPVRQLEDRRGNRRGQLWYGVPCLQRGDGAHLRVCREGNPIPIPSREQYREAKNSLGLDAYSLHTYFQDIVRNIVREVDILHSLSGRNNILNYHDHMVKEREDGSGWDILIRMEYVTPLNKHLQSNAMTREQVVRLGIDICSALAACSGKEIVHRDIKDENIFISSDGAFKLGDFGIARELTGSGRAASMRGTPMYMAPEVFRGEKYDAKVNIYSLGLVLYKLLNNGRMPFLPPYPQTPSYRDGDAALDRRLTREPLPPPCRAGDALGRIVLKACAFAPEGRYANAEQMRQALEGALSGMTEAERDEKVMISHPTPDNDILEGIAPLSEKLVKTESVWNAPAAPPSPPVPAEPPEMGKKPDNRKGGKMLSIVKWLVLTLIVLLILFMGILLRPLVEKQAAIFLPGIFATSTPTPKPTPSPTPTPTLVPTPMPIPTLSAAEINRIYAVGNAITFGTYEQDDITANGKEAIQWRVLERNGSQALLISEENLDCQPYDESNYSVTWETCTLRAWLNSEFLFTAFTAEERQAIPMTLVENNINPEYGTSGGSDTYDQVFLLSIWEAEMLFLSDIDRQAWNTAYADAQGAHTSPDNGAGRWWLRTPLSDGYYASPVSVGGMINRIGFFCNVDNCAVRPALWLDLTSDVVASLAP